MSPLVLPSQLPTAGGWALADFLRRSVQSPPVAAGQTGAVAIAEQLDPDEMWLIDHMVTTCTSGKPTVLRLYAGQIGPGFLLDGTDSGNFCVADWPAGLQLEPSSALVAVWSGATAGCVGTLSVQGRIMRRVG